MKCAKSFAPTDCNIIITGESGTGKELISRYIHFHSNRKDGPFVAINCGALNDELLANELFGHEKGAFTGAHKEKKGLIETAEGGSLLLDEVTDMSPSMQVKLLRVIQEKELLRLGGTNPIPVDVRIIASTNRNMQKLISEGIFRQDLYYRLNVVTFRLPSLSERSSDVPILIHHFLSHYSTLMKKQIDDISPKLMDLLLNYDYPGNIRELENIIERGIALCNGNTFDVIHLPDDFRNLNIKTFRHSKDNIPSLEEQEKNFILWVLKETGGNRTRAAQMLSIDRTSLWRKLKKYGFEEDRIIE
jgi:transcriptional regulator with PAS, ATPase and Fis domain